MGATVTTGKQVCAIRDPNTGTPFYLLFEQTYDKRTYPHTPEWSIISIAPIRETVHAIFIAAGVCEGGMLQGRNGHITPEGYIQGWMKLLKDPLAYPDVQVELNVGEAYWNYLSHNLLRKIKGEVSAFPSAVALLDALEKAPEGRLSLKLHESIGAIAELAIKKNPWGLIKHYENLMTDSGLGYSPEKAKSFQVVVPEFLRINNDERIMKGEDGLWRRAGWAYSVVGNFVSDLWAAEMKEPGSYKKRIKAFREACAGAALVSFPVRVRIDSSDALDLSQYQAKDFKDFLAAIDPVTSDPGAYLVTSEHAELARWTAQQMLVWEPEQQAAA